LWKPPTNDDGAAKEPNVLMFVNHGRNGSTVEIFEHIIDTSTGPVGKLVHVETVKHPLIQYPNDVHPVSSRSFYVTNDHLFSTKIMRKLEAYLSLPTGSLIFRDVDGQVYTAAKRIPYANGIAGYHNNTLLLVVSANTGNIHIYHRDDERVRSGAGYLKSPGEVNHGFSGDNLSVDPMTNKIYVTGTLEALRIFKLAHDPTVVVASKIARLDNLQLGSGGLFSSPSANTVTRLVTNDVEGSGSTVAAVDASRNRMLVGGLLQTGFRVCEIV
jgi:arylesterase/paraoxonase